MVMTDDHMAPASNSSQAIFWLVIILGGYTCTQTSSPAQHPVQVVSHVCLQVFGWVVRM